MRLWLDDVRPAPEGWVHARSVNQAVALSIMHLVTEASLDHDLGDFEVDGGSGLAFVDWLVEHDSWPTAGLTVHSANPVGVQRMLATIDRYAPYGQRRGTWRGH